MLTLSLPRDTDFVRETVLGYVWSQRGTAHGHSFNYLNKEILGNLGHR